MPQEPIAINSYVTATGGVVILNGPFTLEKARRIAALCDTAPDLLAALKSLLNANDQIALSVCTRRAQQGQPCDCRRCAERQAHAAIAKFEEH